MRELQAARADEVSAFDTQLQERRAELECARSQLRSCQSELAALKATASAPRDAPPESQTDAHNGGFKKYV